MTTNTNWHTEHVTVLLHISLNILNKRLDLAKIISIAEHEPINLVMLYAKVPNYRKMLPSQMSINGKVGQKEQGNIK